MNSMFKKASDYLKMNPVNGGNFNIDYYTNLLQQDCADAANMAIWEFREKKASAFKSTYAACNHIMTAVKEAIL